MIKLAPSILAADFTKLESEVSMIEKAGADYLHIDIMDGIFVPNTTIDHITVKKLRKNSKLFFDVHLMVVEPEKNIGDFAKAGADNITVHYESVNDLNRVIDMIKGFGINASVSVKPNTDIEVLYPYLEKIDMVLIMTVEPGLGGQAFIEEMYGKIVKLKSEVEKRNLKIDIEVDGGVYLENIKRVTSAGANVIVAGSAIFKAEDPILSVKRFKEN